MLYNLYHFIHNSWGLCFWTPFAFLVALIMLIVVIVHDRNQKKREDDFEEARNEKLETLKKGAIDETVNEANAVEA